MFDVVKGITATLASYLLAVLLLDSQVPAFAPFAALLVVQLTAYRSIVDSLHLVAAVVIGVALTGLVGLGLGQTFWSLALLVTLTLVIGKWRRLGDYGGQVAVVGLFAFAAGGGDETEYLVSLLATVVIGAAVGVAVSMLLAPPLRFDDAVSAVGDVAAAVRDLLRDMAEGVRSDRVGWSGETWRGQARDVASMVERAHLDVDFDEENRRLNPRLIGTRTPRFTDYRDGIETLGAAVEHVKSIARAFAHLDPSDDGEDDRQLLNEFLPRYADLLDDMATAAWVYRTLEAEDAPQVRGVLDEANERHRDLRRRLSAWQPFGSRTMADCGSLLVDVERFLAELRAAVDRR